MAAMIGLWTFTTDGRPVITPTVAGGVFLGMHQQKVGDPLVRTFHGAVGLALRVYQVHGGSFTWVVGQDGAGNPQLIFTAHPATFNGGPILLLVFAI
ncbi:hypothetical protein P9875_19100 [Janthinobacterium rivuli]|uniref:Uncharacterized protein n=1 Tax=Janthinobacterium rivuli TaxID=2751478 RepID=A0ABY8I100_9BURK|nr:hypothetical protein [Janthinobacterium rivuli]WFR77825.1 hypothetical protein P9875_19100 [Janthinobacterium rivuli]